MLDHGQLGPPTPGSTSTFTPVESPHRGSAGGSASGTRAEPPSPDGAPTLGRGMPEALSMSLLVVEPEVEREKKPESPSVNGVSHPNSISAQLYANPNLAPLRTAGRPVSATQPPTLTSVPPILVDPRCSGYFVETVCPYDSTPHCSLTSRH